MLYHATFNLIQSHGRKILVFLLILAFLGASWPQATASAAESDCQETYTVQSGDYLIKIAAQYGGISYLEIAEANDLQPPYTVSRGQKLCIPFKGSAGSSGSSSASASGDITSKKQGSKLEVSVKNLGKNAFYYVRVDNANKTGYEWFKIGVLKTDDDREGEGSYSLPDELDQATAFNVCLKHTVNDDLICDDPSLSNVEDDGSTSTGGTGSASISFSKRGDRLEVSVENFPRNTTFFVRVDDANKSAYEWFRVGVLRTGSDRQGDGIYTLPEELEDTNSFNVCLKNSDNDDLICDDPALSVKGDTDDDNDSGSTKNASFTVARLSGGRFTISTSRFPKDSFWNVKVREWGAGGTDWATLGILRTEGDSAAHYTYELPNELDDVDDLYICLKNLTSNDLKCVVSLQ
jgi:LysM repeat protein